MESGLGRSQCVELRGGVQTPQFRALHLTDAMFSRNRSAPGDDLIVDKGADDWSAFGDPRRTIGPKGRADMEMDIAITQMTKRSEEHTSELQSLMRISYAVFCLKQKTQLAIKPKKTT